MTRQKSTFETNKFGREQRTAPELKKALAFIGLFTRVAKKIGVTPSHAVAVANGRRQSKRVTDAVISEVRRIEREAERAA